MDGLDNHLDLETVLDRLHLPHACSTADLEKNPAASLSLGPAASGKAAATTPLARKAKSKNPPQRNMDELLGNVAMLSAGNMPTRRP